MNINEFIFAYEKLVGNSLPEEARKVREIIGLLLDNTISQITKDVSPTEDSPSN